MHITRSPRIDAALAAAEWQKLERECRSVLRKKPNDQQANRLIGFALRRLGRNDEALVAYQRAAIRWPQDAEILINHAQTLMEVGRWADAAPLLEKATVLRPERFVIWTLYNHALYMSHRNAEGLICAERMRNMADSTPEKVAALNALALHTRELGGVCEAVAFCEEAVALEPRDLTSHTNRLLFMLADSSRGAVQMLDAARAYGAVAEEIYAPFRTSHEAHQRTPHERLRLGFLSPDFRNHAVMYFMEGVLAQMDRRQFVVVGLHLHGGTDPITERARTYADEFVDLANRPFPEQLAAIQQAKIDILIDLAGHTGHNGLAFMACKPAPIQATWIGYPGTTGMKAIDYLITDEATDPTGTESLYTEKLLKLNSRLCVYRPLIRNPLYRYQPAYAVKQTPALSNGYVTFGSCNNLGKLTDDVLRTWSNIVNQVPGAKILIEGKGFEDPEVINRYRDRCVELGFKLEQLIFVPIDGRNQYLTYHQIDIALDPFPLNGGTTSMDVLWMGVPLVAMAGRSFRDRMSAGILLHLGRDEWVAHDREDYVRRACALASNVEELNALRLSLRNEVEQSILMREDRFCHRFGLSLRRIWVQWLAEQQFPQDLAQQSAYLEEAMAHLPSEWFDQPAPGVGLKPGVRVSLSEAQNLMHVALQKAHDADQKIKEGALKRAHPYWHELTALCDTVLSSVPNEPFALTCLAEVEHASGHTDFAVTYLRYAQTAIALNTQA